MKQSAGVLIFLAICIVSSCSPQTTATCSECEFFEYEYTENLSIISGFDTTRILIEQPYTDWELVDSPEDPEIVKSNISASDSTVVLRLTIEAGAGAEEARANYEIGFDGDKFRVWYGSASRRYFKAKQLADPRPPFFRIRQIEVRTPYQKEAEIDFNIRY